MKILFAGVIERKMHSSRQRMTALQQNGHEVAGVPILHSTKLPSLRRFLPRPLYEALLTPYARNSHDKLLSAAGAAKPDLIWLEWPMAISPSTIRALRKAHPKVKIVSYQDDNPFGNRKFADFGWQRFFRAMPLYDLHFVKREADIRNYEALGARNVRVIVTGFPEDLCYPETENPWPDPQDVVFVGTALEDGRTDFLNALVQAGVEVHVYGMRWERTELYKNRPDLCHGFIGEEDFRRVVSAAKIALGFVSHSNCDEYTGRLFEVPACGAMFLGESTELQKRLMAPDREAVYFTSVEDCRDKIRHYLTNEPQRKAIAETGHNRALEFGFRHRMEEAIDVIKSTTRI